MEPQLRPAAKLEGLDLGNGWKVMKTIKKGKKGTGGNFSVGYEVQNSEGQKAYLKAYDLTSAFGQRDLTKALQEMTSAFNFERDLLIKCKDKKLGRIIKPILHGQTLPPLAANPYEVVWYLIFELADSDVRNYVANLSNFDLVWCLKSLHHTAVGLEQLHTNGIAHQDLKPSNVLFFKTEGSKIGDLGSASDVSAHSMNDVKMIAGDVTYAPLELFYQSYQLGQFYKRALVDIYLFGSLFFFYFSGLSCSEAIRSRLKARLTCGTPQEDFLKDIPYIKMAYETAIKDLKEELRKITPDLEAEIIRIVKELCEPDPEKRGDKGISGVIPKYSLQRIISSLDSLAKKAERNFK